MKEDQKEMNPMVIDDAGLLQLNFLLHCWVKYKHMEVVKSGLGVVKC